MFLSLVFTDVLSLFFSQFLFLVFFAAFLVTTLRFDVLFSDIKHDFNHTVKVTDNNGSQTVHIHHQEDTHLSDVIDVSRLSGYVCVVYVHYTRTYPYVFMFTIHVRSHMCLCVQCLCLLYTHLSICVYVYSVRMCLLYTYLSICVYVCRVYVYYRHTYCI